jgi:uncharacterized repeat protein (TIGR02543 family)
MKLALLLSIGILSYQQPQVAVNLTHSVSFIIINDTQSTTIIVDDGELLFVQPTFIPRDNVRLNGWYYDTALTNRVDFDLPIEENKTYYAAWTYLVSSFAPATVTLSEEGNRFESEQVVLSFSLYEPLAVNVRYQWQQALMNTQDFKDIGGAVTAQFRPFQNGTMQYRLQYKVPIYNAGGLVVGSTSYYTAPVTLTIYGQQTLTGYVIALGFVFIGSLLAYFLIKRKIYFETDGGAMLAPAQFKVGEDASLLPKASKKGYTFQGWYYDEARTIPYEGIRMPTKSLKLYAKYKKRKS